ncbi:MAG: prepilin peptidase [bacterium]|nr:prepilin peptidase [bacterium]
MPLIVFIFGLCIGSFLNVCISRLIHDESIVFPASHCPKCRKKIKWYDNIPVVSFLLLKGKCRNCFERISWQYPIVEILTAVIFLCIFTKWGFSRELIVYNLFVSGLLVIAFIDAKTTFIPDVITIPGMIAGLILKVIFAFIDKSFTNLFDAGSGMILGLAVFGFIVIVSRGGMGIGDIKLAGLIGVFLGLKNTFSTIWLSFILGGIVGIFLLVSKLKGRKDAIPFGPYLVMGALISMFWGENILNWWLGH